ncbi:non-contractile tail fiber protein [Escherichia phage P1723]|uniref:Non-contractile tail fiber protein n=1 Tax=Escherichia phage P1723 TaxID=2736274 RepID=A0A6M9QBV4_9CAUD|nr:non-contractile tail fiber protein [Escherichia phage P1723]
MANVIKTVYTYPLDGTTTDFAIPFEYLSRKFVVVTLIGQDRKELVVVTDYRFATRNLISTTKAWGPADNYQQIEIRRYTSASERLVDFSDGSILRATDLNVSQIQTLHVAEEARDLTADTIGVNNDGNLDGRGRRIVNVADGVDAGDVVTVGQMNRWSGSAADSANKAKVSETNAKTSETNSKASELLAQKWAENPKGTPVVSSQYSAKHWALTSEDSANASATSAGNSQAQVANAKTQADRAGGYANDAMGYRDAANTSAQQAAVSEGNAATSASNAKTESDKLIQFNTLVDRINGVAVRQVGEFEVHNSRTYAKPGTVYGDGQLLNRNQFPALVAELLAGHLPVVSDSEWLADPGKRGCYTLGNGTTTFRVPDLNGVYAGSIKAPVFRGDAGFTVGDVQKSALPNIEGLIALADNELASSASGAFYNAGRSNKGATNDTGGAQLGFDASLWNEIYKKDTNEARMNSVVIVWVIRTHGVVNNPGSVDAAVLSSRVEQVYTELLTRMVANENLQKSGQKFLRRVFSDRTSQGQLSTGRTVTCSEDILNKMLVIGAHTDSQNPNSQIYRCSPFLQPNTADRMHLTLSNWSYTLEFPAANQVKLVAATGSGVQAINYIDVVCDYPQT